MRLMQTRADNKRRFLRGIPLKCIIGAASMALRYGELSSRMLASVPPIASKGCDSRLPHEGGVGLILKIPERSCY
jgi:hypothetical protein